MDSHRRKRAAALAAAALLSLCGAGGDAVAQGRPGKGAQARANARRGQRPQTAGDDGSTRGHLDAGHRHADAGDWTAALEAYKSATAINPRHPEAHIFVGDAYMNLGRYEEAVAAFKEAARVAPSNAEAHAGLGEAYNFMDMHSDAFKPFVQAIGLDPRHAEAHYGIGYAYLRLGNFKEALVFLNRAIRLRKDYPEARLSLGLAHIGLGQKEVAAEQLGILKASDVSLARELEKELRKAGAALSETTDTRVETLTARPQQRTPDPAAATSRRMDASSATGGPPKEASDPPAPARSASSKIETAEPPPADSASRLAADLNLWDRIKNSDDPEEFAAYLKSYPAGQFAGLARIRLRVLESKRGAVETTAGSQREAAPAPSRTAAPAPAPPPAPAPTPATASPAVTGDWRRQALAETLKSLKEGFSNKLTYTATAPGEDANVVRVTSEVMIEYEPLQFENCRIEWRAGKNTWSVALPDLDPLGIKVEPLSKPNTTFSAPIWSLTVKTDGGAPAIKSLRSDGGGANNHSSIDLLYGDKERAERLARLLQQAINLCEGAP